MSTNLTARPGPALDGSRANIALVCARFNDVIVDRLESGARTALIDHGVLDSDIETIWVPGALEIPSAASWAVSAGRFDAVVALGTIIRGDTYHFEIVADQSAAGLMRLALDTGAVITNAILTVETVEQAMVRAGEGGPNKGAEAALGALEMIAVARTLTPSNVPR